MKIASSGFMGRWKAAPVVCALRLRFAPMSDRLHPPFGRPLPMQTRSQTIAALVVPIKIVRCWRMMCLGPIHHSRVALPPCWRLRYEPCSAYWAPPISYALESRPLSSRPETRAGMVKGRTGRAHRAAG
jgi:hypothetical protein